MHPKSIRNRLLVERPLPQDGRERGGAAPGGRSRRIRKVPRSVAVNLAESPLGWLLARDLVTERQFAAGEQLRIDWEKAGLPPRVTTAYDAPPMGKEARAAPRGSDPTAGQLAAKRRFEAAVARVGPGLADILWRVVCAGEGMRDAETALGWPARSGRLILTMALDRLADFYRLR